MKKPGPNTAHLELTLSEIEVILLVTRPGKQDYGKFYDNAVKKLNLARRELLGMFAESDAGGNEIAAGAK